MALTPDQKEVLVKVISDALSKRINLSFSDIPKLLSAAKAIGSDNEPIIEGLKRWIQSDPQAQALVMEAAMRAGSALFSRPAPEPEVVKEAEVVK